MKNLLIASAASALMAVSGAAVAQERVFASADLNVRAGPGTNYRVVGAIGANDSANVLRCTQNARWCEISYRGGDGWVSARYLADGGRYAYRDGYRGYHTNAGVATGAATGVIAGALVGGPVGAVVGGIAGSAIGAGADVAAEGRIDRTMTSSTVPAFVLPQADPSRQPEQTVVYYAGHELRVETSTGRVVDVLR